MHKSIMYIAIWTEVELQGEMFLMCTPIIDRGWVVQKPVNINSGCITFSCKKYFSLLMVCAVWDYSNWKQKKQTNYKQKTSQQSYKTLANKNSRLSWVSLIGLWTTQPRFWTLGLSYHNPVEFHVCVGFIRAWIPISLRPCELSII